MSMVWARAEDLQERIANVPDNWLRRFAMTFPDDTRKLGDANYSTRIYRVAKVLEAIELGLCSRKYREAMA